MSGELLPKEAENFQAPFFDELGVSANSASQTGYGKPERKSSGSKVLPHPLVETLSGNCQIGRRTHVRSRSDATGLLSVANPISLSKYHELSGQLHQHLNQVRVYSISTSKLAGDTCPKFNKN
jgi:hypothetical protein